MVVRRAVNAMGAGSSPARGARGLKRDDCRYDVAGIKNLCLINL